MRSVVKKKKNKNRSTNKKKIKENSQKMSDATDNPIPAVESTPAATLATRTFVGKHTITTKTDGRETPLSFEVPFTVTEEVGKKNRAVYCQGAQHVETTAGASVPAPVHAPVLASIRSPFGEKK
jgi:hypothetical protein